MAAKLDIYNMALTNIGVSDLLQSEYGSTKVHALFNLVFPHVYREFLSLYDWSFARKRAELSRDEDTEPPTNWAYAYWLPEDCLRVRSIVIPGLRTPAKRNRIPYEVATDVMHYEGVFARRKLFCDLPEVEIIYTAEVEAEALPGEAVRAFAFLLASHIAVPMTMKGDIMQANRQAYEYAVLQAATADLNEEEPDREPLPELLEGRCSVDDVTRWGM